VRLTATITDELQVPPPSHATVQTIGGYRIAETFQSGQSKGLGITFIIIAIVAIIFNIVGIAVEDPFAYSGHGFWSCILVNALHISLHFSAFVLERRALPILKQYGLLNFGRLGNLIIICMIESTFSICVLRNSEYRHAVYTGAIALFRYINIADDSTGLTPRTNVHSATSNRI
jgi:hypothetical protein